MGFESLPSSPENKAPDPAVLAAAENIIGPPPLADPAMFETGPKFDYTPPVAEVEPLQDPALKNRRKTYASQQLLRNHPNRHIYA